MVADVTKHGAKRNLSGFVVTELKNDLKNKQNIITKKQALEIQKIAKQQNVPKTPMSS
ncbi:MAG: hypothetical protein HRU24_11010 [Gammaproteobacteria bacterium]|nr:hypothetical protein [Gammaproteobacteria bacterium]